MPIFEMTPRALGRISLMTATALMASMTVRTAPVQAQDIAATPAPQAGGLEDIVVTARKRAESTQDVPVSVTVLSAEALDRYDMSSLERVSASTPSFVIGRSPSGSGATLVLRGIGSNTTSIGLEQSVAVVVDGVYYGQGRVINEGFFDLGRLEILKGPQALFFGKNATAGVVSITTADPSDKTEIIGRLGYEFNAQDVVAEAIASGPLSDTLGVRIAVRGSKMFGSLFGNDAPATDYRTTDIVTGAVTDHIAPAGVSDSGKGKELYGRLTLKWQPTDRLTATIKANAGFNNNNNPAANSVIFRCPTSATTANPNIACTKRFVSSANRFPAALTAIQPYARSNGDTGNRYKAWAVTANLNYEMDDVTLTSVTNYNYNRNIFIFDADSVAADGPGSNWATEWSDWKAFSSEARLLTTLDSPVNVMVGALYQKTKRNYKAWTAAGGVENSAAPFPYQRYLTNSKLSHTDGETIAAFGQATWKILENLEVAGGVRYTHETKDSDFVQPYSHPLRVAAGIFLPNVTITDNGIYNNWSPEATITYKPSRDITLYGAYKTAYKSGGFSNSGILSPSATIDDFAFGPEKARGFEAGVKTTLLDRQLRLNIGLYTYKYEDLQIDFFNSSVFAFSTINAGSARTKGVELEMEYAPHTVSGLNLRGSLNYNHARYGDVPSAPCYAGQTIAAGCTIAAPGQRPSQNLIGKPTANAPDWAASLGASYETSLTNDIDLIVSTDSRYSASYLSSAFAHPLARQDRYINLDASVRLKSIDDRWEFAVIGKNLTNRFYATGGTDAPGTGSGTGTAGGIPADQIGFIAAPRTVQAQVTFRY